MILDDGIMVEMAAVEKNDLGHFCNNFGYFFSFRIDFSFSAC